MFARHFPCVVSANLLSDFAHLSTNCVSHENLNLPQPWGHGLLNWNWKACRNHQIWLSNHDPIVRTFSLRSGTSWSAGSQFPAMACSRGRSLTSTKLWGCPTGHFLKAVSAAADAQHQHKANTTRPFQAAIWPDRSFQRRFRKGITSRPSEKSKTRNLTSNPSPKCKRSCRL